MENKKHKYYVGMFIAVFKGGQKCAPIPPNAKLFISQSSAGDQHPRTLKIAQMKLHVVSRGQIIQTENTILNSRQKGDEIIHEFLNLHGKISHCYDEIWWFLLNAGYAKLYVQNLDYEFEGFDDFSLVEVSVYLKQKAINDNYELKILRYPTQKMGKGKKNSQERAKMQQQQKRISQEEAKQEYLRFARLSLLLVFDLMNIQIVKPALIKSDKQFKIYFSLLANLNRKNSDKPDVAFKPFPRYVMDTKHYFESYISSKNFYNKLFTQQEIKNCSLYKDKGRLYCQDIQFQPVLEAIHLYKHTYFQKLILNLFDEVNKFIKRSLSSVVKNMQPLYQRYVYQTIFIQEGEIKNDYHNNDLYLSQHADLIRKSRILSSQSGRLIRVLDDKKQSLYKECSHPIFPILCPIQFNRFIEFDNITFKNQKELDEYNYTKKQMLSEFLDQAIQLSEGKYEVSEDTNKNDINDFLNFTTGSKLEQYQTPKSMRSELKPHQKQALLWMLQREGHMINDGAIQQEKEQKLSPLWQQVVLVDGDQFYVNTFTAKISDQFQSFQETKGGILADEMGLGKTIMALALILETQRNGFQTLIVLPKSVIVQWEEEIIKHSKPNSLKVLSYYKQQNRSKNINLKDYDIILTTYTLLGIEYSIWLKINGVDDDNTFQEVHQEKQKVTNPVKKETTIKQESSESESDLEEDHDDIKLSEDSDDTYEEEEEKQVKYQSLYKKKVEQSQQQYDKIFQEEPKNENKKKKVSKRKLQDYKKYNNLFDHKYHRIVLDEAHNIKTRNTLQTRGAVALESEYRWCLTGTPMQNKHDDLFSLIQFLRVETFSEYFWWNTYVNKEENEDDQQKILHQILAPITLRRTKNQQTFEGMQQIQESINWIDLSEKELILYKRLFSGSQNLFKSYLQAESNQTFVHIFQIINKLRMACDHPQLALKNVNFEGNNIEAILTKIDKFFEDKKNTGQKILTDKYKKELIENIQNGEIQECLICAKDDIQVFALSSCGHIYCFECFKEAVVKLGTCPSCRKKLTIEDLIQVEAENEKQNLQFQEIIIGVSSKVKAVVEETIKVKAKREKVLIFTQWLEMIRILEQQFKENDIYYQVITGCMTVDKRSRIIKAFENQNHQTALLLSLRATSTGLNLTMANNVFLVDPWWNPAIEDQAIGRADRIGQQLQVNVIRFLCKNTIEQQINLLHQKKKHMIRKALSNEQKKKQEIEDYKFLLLQH